MCCQCSGMETTIGCVRVLSVGIQDSDLCAACHPLCPFRKEMRLSGEQTKSQTQLTTTFLSHPSIMSIHTHYTCWLTRLSAMHASKECGKLSSLRSSLTTLQAMACPRIQLLIRVGERLHVKTELGSFL